MVDKQFQTCSAKLSEEEANHIVEVCKGTLNRADFSRIQKAVAEDLASFQKCDGNCLECKNTPKLSLAESAELMTTWENQLIAGTLSREKFEALKSYLGRSLQPAAVESYKFMVNPWKDR